MTEGHRPRIAVVGSNMVDLVTYVDRMPVKGETVEAPSFEMGHGGKGANQAVAAAFSFSAMRSLSWASKTASS